MSEWGIYGELGYGGCAHLIKERPDFPKSKDLRSTGSYVSGMLLDERRRKLTFPAYLWPHVSVSCARNSSRGLLTDIETIPQIWMTIIMLARWTSQRTARSDAQFSHSQKI